MRVTLGKPQHGWVDLTISDGPFAMTDSVADTPIDFVAGTAVQLTNLLTTGRATDVPMHLEPGYYVFAFARDGDDFRFRLLHETEAVKPVTPRLLHCVTGPFQAVIAPFVSALERFYDTKFDAADWPACDATVLQDLQVAVRQYLDR